jgi:hypothetical protein
MTFAWQKFLSRDFFFPKMQIGQFFGQIVHSNLLGTKKTGESSLEPNNQTNKNVNCSL